MSTYSPPYVLACLMMCVSLSGAILSSCAGESHACIVIDVNKFKCWGDNSYGQLCMGDNVSRGRRPQDVPPLPLAPALQGAVLIDVECGARHTCIRTNRGGVYCCGDNTYGQLGIGSSIPSMNILTTQVALAGPSISLCLGADFGCSVSATFPFPVQCWGKNNLGQLCTGNATSYGSKPSDFPLPTVVITGSAVYCGHGHAMLLTNTGSLLGWGDNRYGQLGYGSVQPPYDMVGVYPGSHPLVPAFPLVPGIVRTVRMGSRHTCLLYATGNVTCMGSNANGQLGYPGIESVGNSLEYLPPPIVPLSFVAVTVSAGYDYTCSTGYLRVPYLGMQPNVTACWGENGSGQLGYGNMIQGIGIVEGTMPPPILNCSLPVISPGVILSASTKGTSYLVLSSSVLRGGNVSVAPHLVVRQALVGWGSNARGQLLTGKNTSDSLNATILNTECGDSLLDVPSGEECDLGTSGNGQVCTPFCSLLPCSVSDPTCNTCHLPSLSRYTADLPGCFLTTLQCPNTSPLSSAMCINGTWSVRAIDTLNLTLSVPLMVVGPYTAQSNGVVVLLPNGSLVVKGPAQLDGTLILSGVASGRRQGTTAPQNMTTIDVLTAETIDGTFSSVLTTPGSTMQCTSQEIRDAQGLAILAISIFPCPTASKLPFIGIAVGIIFSALVVGTIMIVLYRKGICRCAFRERDSYDAIGPNY